MDLEKLLLGKERCECGKSHLCPIKKVEISKDNNLPIRIVNTVENSESEIPYLFKMTKEK